MGVFSHIHADPYLSIKLINQGRHARGFLVYGFWTVFEFIDDQRATGTGIYRIRRSVVKFHFETTYYAVQVIGFAVYINRLGATLP